MGDPIGKLVVAVVGKLSRVLVGIVMGVSCGVEFGAFGRRGNHEDQTGTHCLPV